MLLPPDTRAAPFIFVTVPTRCFEEDCAGAFEAITTTNANAPSQVASILICFIDFPE
jgi:hypothetical protein